MVQAADSGVQQAEAVLSDRAKFDQALVDAMIAMSAEIMKDELSAETADAIGDDGRDENGKAHKP